MVSVYIFFFMVSFKFCKDMLYTAFSPIVGFWLKKKNSDLQISERNGYITIVTFSSKSLFFPEA